MLFNSYAFILLFLPAVLAGFFAIGRRSQTIALAWLAGASVLFYAAWNWHLTWILLASVAANYGAGRILSGRAARGAGVRWHLALFVGADLLLLGYYKYAGFFAGLSGIVLPIGISFFTFTQIAFLVDTARGKTGPTGFVRYLLFVTYFPHLIAGPVLHHAEMMPQFARRDLCTPRARAFAVGISVFLLGLFKKVALADALAPIANAAFDPAQAAMLDLAGAWGGALAYTLQIYLDFSAYTDMAIGISLLFNIRLPANFDSPYQARSIIEFWRRWHMTLSRFLRDYLYIPLGGSRHGTLRRHANLMATMLLGGLWHGAGWTFILWGGLHGLYLICNHAWRHLRGRIGGAPGHTESLAGWALTLGAAIVAWVFFRAPDLATAFAVLRGMAGLRGLSWPLAVGRQEIALLALLLGMVLLLPNIGRIMAGEQIVLAMNRAAPMPAGPLRWRPSLAWATCCAGLFAASLLQMTRVSQFLYFQF